MSKQPTIAFNLFEGIKWKKWNGNNGINSIKEIVIADEIDGSDGIDGTPLADKIKNLIVSLKQIGNVEWA